MVGRKDEEERNRIVKTHVVYTLIWEAGYYYHGSTCNYRNRKRKHLSTLEHRSHGNIMMQRIFNKYGKWDCEFLRMMPSESDAIGIEQKLISRDIGKRACINISPIVNSPPKPDFEQLSANGKKSGKITHKLRIGVHGMTPKERTAAGKKGGKKARELGVGIFGMTHEERVVAGKKAGAISGRRNRKFKRGIFGLSFEQRSANSKKSAKRNYERGIGLAGIDPSQHSANSRKGGTRVRELKLGIHAQSDNERLVYCKMGGEIAHKKRLGVHGRSREQMSADGKEGGKKGGPIGCHIRWHINRNIVNPDCDLCCNSAKV